MWVPEVAELPDESRCSHAEPLLETDSHQPICSGAERDGERREKCEGEKNADKEVQIGEQELFMSFSRGVIITGHRVRKAQKYSISSS